MITRAIARRDDTTSYCGCTNVRGASTQHRRPYRYRATRAAPHPRLCFCCPELEFQPSGGCWSGARTEGWVVCVSVCCCGLCAGFQAARPVRDFPGVQPRPVPSPSPINNKQNAEPTEPCTPRSACFPRMLMENTTLRPIFTQAVKEFTSTAGRKRMLIQAESQVKDFSCSLGPQPA